MAASLEERVKERERAERTLLNRSFQQTVVAALGQFAMVSNDISALLNQAVMLVAQTLEVEYCHILELQPGGKFLLLRAGVGWKNGCVGRAVIPADPQTESGFTLTAGEAVVFEHLAEETRFRGSSLLAGPRRRQWDHRRDCRTWAGVRHPRGAHRAPAEIHGGRDPFPVLPRDRAGDGGGADSDGGGIAEAGRFRPVESQPGHGTGRRRHHHLFQRRRAQAGPLGRPGRSARDPASQRPGNRPQLPGDGPKRAEPANRIRGAHPFLVVSSHGRQPGGALLRRGHHRPAEPGSPVAPVAEDGVNRPTGRRRGARFQ